MEDSINIFDFELIDKNCNIKEIEEGVFKIKDKDKKFIILTVCYNMNENSLILTLFLINPILVFSARLEFEELKNHFLFSNKSLEEIYIFFKFLLVEKKIQFYFDNLRNMFNFSVSSDDSVSPNFEVKLKKNTIINSVEIINFLFKLVISITDFHDNFLDSADKKTRKTDFNKTYNIENDEGDNTSFNNKSVFIESKFKKNTFKKYQENSNKNDSNSQEFKIYGFKPDIEKLSIGDSFLFNDKYSKSENKKSKITINKIKITNEKFTSMLYIEKINQLILGTFSGKLMIWDFDSESFIFKTHEEDSEIIKIIELDIKTIALIVEDKIKIWNLGLKICEKILNNCPSYIQILKLNEKFLLTYFYDNHMKIYNLHKDFSFRTISLNNTTLNKIISIDENRFATASKEGIVSVWDIKNRIIRRQIVVDKSINDMVLVCKETLFASLNDSMKIKIIDISKGDTISQINFKDTNIFFGGVFKNHLLIYYKDKFFIDFFNLENKNITLNIECIKEKRIEDISILRNGNLAVRYLDRIKLYEITID